MTNIIFYDLELLQKPKIFWSPNACKTRFALNLKNIPYETKWIDFGRIKEVIPPITKLDKRPTLPVIVDVKHDNQPVEDSWNIAVHLEKEYPNNPSLFHGNEGLHKFFQIYSEYNVLPYVFRLVVLYVCKNTGPPELQKWFRDDREKRFGMTLEKFVGEDKDNITALKKGLIPVDKVLQDKPYVTGDKAGYADIILASHLTFLFALRPELFEEAVLSAFGPSDNPIRSWWARMEKYRNGVPSSRL
ncbi:MAG: hypothetical protein EXX96DRAFT_497882 [Benjaminiella poitrasii]|nr:MAG: hypothetical protein EXX96DRAFT_497882 [Benjaminiella poitrasii]